MTLTRGSVQPCLKVYIAVERGHYGTDQPFGIGVAVVTEEGLADIYRGNGYSSDGDWISLAAIAQILERYPESAFNVHTAGVRDRVGHWRKGNGRKSNGGLFVGHEFLLEVVRAVDTSRLSILGLPVGFSPAHQWAKAAAKDALAEVVSDPSSTSYVQVVLEPRTMLTFKLVRGGDRVPF